MYCTYYGLKERPFTLTPNPEFIFLGTAHQEAFAHLLYGIGQKVGFIALTGEVGAGKTTVIRTLLTRLEPEQYATALILNPMLSSLGLLKTINREFGIPDAGTEPAELVETLNQFLLQQKEVGKTVVLVIDEAQDMEPVVLEQIRLLSNLETATEKLIQIVLVGQPELETLLGRKELRQLNQRITVRYHMLPMNSGDTKAYLSHRLRAANGTPDLIRFSDTAAMAIYRYSGGLPRLVNAVADRALLIGYNRDARKIDADMIKQAIKEVAPTAKRAFFSGKRLALAVGTATLLCGALVYGTLQTNHIKPKQTTAAVLPADANRLPKLVQRLNEQSSIQEAVQTVCTAWQMPPQTTKTLAAASLESAVKAAGFEALRYSGSLGGLARIGYPAILELSPSDGTKSYLVFGGLTQEYALVADSSGSLVEVPTTALEKIWNGRAILPWKNVHRLRIPVPYLKASPEQTTLSHLLVAAGVLKNDQTRNVPAVLTEAVKRFQANQGLEPDGIIGAQTLLLLYRSSGELRLPTLKKAEKTAHEQHS